MYIVSNPVSLARLVPEVPPAQSRPFRPRPDITANRLSEKEQRVSPGLRVSTHVYITRPLAEERRNSRYVPGCNALPEAPPPARIHK